MRQPCGATSIFDGFIIVSGDCSDPLQALRHIMIVCQAPKHIGMPPEKYFRVFFLQKPPPPPNPFHCIAELNILSVDSWKTIVKLYWSAFFRIDKVGNVAQIVFKHCCQLGGVKKIWGGIPSVFVSDTGSVSKGLLPSTKASSSVWKSWRP